jgi:hypothetical protein
MPNTSTGNTTAQCNVRNNVPSNVFPEWWFHQHFNLGKEPAKYLAIHGRFSRKHKSGMKDWKLDTNLKEGGDQIEYEDEDPMIREMFEKDLAKRGLKCEMPKIKQ